jgi:hypothetical protein
MRKQKWKHSWYNLLKQNKDSQMFWDWTTERHNLGVALEQNKNKQSN